MLYKKLILSWDGLTYHLRSKNYCRSYLLTTLRSYVLSSTILKQPTIMYLPLPSLSLPTLLISCVTLSLTLNNKVTNLFFTHNHTTTHFTFSPFSSLKQIIKHTLLIPQFPFFFITIFPFLLQKINFSHSPTRKK